MKTEGLVWEVLIHLPTKSLMRFKCVSKLWYSIIRNPNFAIAHSNIGGSFRGLLISGICNQTSSWTRKLFYLNHNDCPRLMSLHLSIPYKLVTGAVKGLIGLFARGSNDFTLCNIATHELLNLPPSPDSHLNKGTYCYCYHLGFDPVKELYKVLYARLSYDEEHNITGHQSHVFTLGVNYSEIKWRNIDPAPSSDLYDLTRQCLCIDGTLYWLCPTNLTAFHLNSETFETIQIPECINSSAILAEISGSPALVVIDVWTMNNHYRRGELEAWTRKSVCLPTSFNNPGILHYAGTLPTGEMLLAGARIYNFPFPIYIYDHLTNVFKSLVVEGYGSQESGMDYDNITLYGIRVCYYEENIISLDSLMCNQEEGRTTTSN